MSRSFSLIAFDATVCSNLVAAYSVSVFKAPITFQALIYQYSFTSSAFIVISE
jgi:hypothetical protein